MKAKPAEVLMMGGGLVEFFHPEGVLVAGDITRNNYDDRFVFKPMLYEYLSGEVEAWHIAPDCKELLDEKVRFIRGQVTKIDLEARAVTIAGHTEPLSYDVLVFAPGAVTNYAGLEGAEQFALPF